MSPLRSLLVAAAALLLLGACTGRPPTPTGYGETTEKNFMEGCLESARDEGVTDAQGYCQCSYEAIVDDIPFDQFKEINSDLSETPDSLPDEMQAIAERCASSQ
jgi:hypothetical protein